jgi:PST family polysaccharide transporter
VLCAQGLGVWGLVLGSYAQLLSQTVIAWAFVGWRPRLRQAEWAIWRQLAGFARHVVTSELLRRVASQVDTIALGRLEGAGPLGQYRYGLRLATLPSDAWVNIAAYVLLPGFARIAEDVPRLRRAFEDSLVVMLAFAAPASLVLIPLGDEFAMLVLGPSWPLAGDAAQALAGVGVGTAIGSVGSEVFKATGQPHRLVRLHAVGLVGVLALVPAFAVYGGVVAVGVAVSLVAMLQGAYALHASARVVDAPLREVIGRIGGLALAVLLAVGATVALDAAAFGEAESRADVLVPIVTQLACLAVTLVAALRLLAPRELALVIRAGRDLRRSDGEP